MMTIPVPYAERRFDPDYCRNRKSVMDVVTASAMDAYGVTRPQMMSHQRIGAITVPRQISMFLLREFGFSLHEIGDYFRRHHVTVVDSHQRINDRIARDETFHIVVSMIAKRAGLI